MSVVGADPPALAILRERTPLDLVEAGGEAGAIAWPGTGSHSRAMHRIALEAGGRTRPLRHEGEAAYVVATGAVAARDLDAGAELELEAPAVLYVPHGAGYVLAARSASTVFGGPCPPDPALYDGAAPAAAGGARGALQAFDPRREGLPIPMISRQGRLVVWPGMGAEVATMVYVILEPGDENDPHAHESSDDTIAILDGRGSIDNLTDGETHEFEAGDVVFVRAGIGHKVKADRGSRIVAVGGPCPPDYGMLRALGAV